MLKYIILIFTLLLSCKPSYDSDVLYRHEVNEGLVGVELIDGRVGFEDLEGNLVIDFDFQKAGPRFDEKMEYNTPVVFNDGLSPVLGNNNLEGYINNKGEWAIEPKYQVAQNFHKGIARIILPEEAGFKSGYINTNDEIVLGPFDQESWNFFYFYPSQEHGIYQSKENDLFGIIGPKGQIKVEAKYEEIENISEQRAQVYGPEGYQFIDMSGRVIHNGRGRHFINGTTFVGRTNEQGRQEIAVIDLEGNILLDYTDEIKMSLDSPTAPIYQPFYNDNNPKAMYYPIVEGVFPTLSSQTNRYGLYSISGEWLTEPEYVQISWIEDGVWGYRHTNDRYGFMNNLGEEIPYPDDGSGR
jgi:hypothetical protein